MKTTEERLAAIEAELAEIPRRGKWVSTYERDLIKAALQFARLKHHQTSIDSEGIRHLHCKTDADDLAKYYSREMESAASGLLIEMGLETPRD
jgi:hypothetical protein